MWVGQDMSLKYPALDVIGADSELLEALVDDFSPTAAEQHENRTTYFFTDAPSRARAHEAIAQAWPAASIATREVDDEDWARRSQANLTPITVGRITIAPPWHAASVSNPQSALTLDSIVLVITPSMGFGTGHHATTRLCLRALQTIDLTDRLMLDVGTGSGVLAIAGRALGARHAVGIDQDVDAIQSAAENLDANPRIDGVDLIVGDVRTYALVPSDVVTANLTGPLLAQSAPRLLSTIRPGGRLIVSGLLMHEREDVVAAFSHRARLVWEDEEQGWLGLMFNSEAVDTV